MAASFEQKENRTEPKQFFAVSDIRFLRVAFFSNAVGRGVRSRNEHAKGRTDAIVSTREPGGKGQRIREAVRRLRMARSSNR